ncbi:hypothetical protein AAFF_G00174680 [Aldrovandia affinis]|uniref:Synaptonemal complex central element protein 1 n=1 Tax=Aldrovandia affinis TaxID=143900 RepID=A0AAD7RLR5_9TELE|nr:hypothetical protein AAFF_G00174680 [Aldrovandia affinis]
MASGGNSDLKMDELLGKIKEMQQAKKDLEEDFKEAQLLRKTLQKELDALNAEKYQIEEIHNEREESYKVLQFKYEELECEAKRLLQLNSKIEALIEQCTFEIQEARLKHRKQRMKFENQLQQLIEQHKNLCSVYSPDRLPSEIENVENAKSQLLKAEQVKLTHLHHLTEETNQTP